MVLGEAITFDTDLVLALFAVLVIVLVLLVVLMVVAIKAGYRAGRYPDRTRARVAWLAIGGFEVLVFVYAVLVRAAPPLLLITASVAASSFLAHWLGRTDGQRDRASTDVG